MKRKLSLCTVIAATCGQRFFQSTNVRRRGTETQASGGAAAESRGRVCGGLLYMAASVISRWFAASFLAVSEVVALTSRITTCVWGNMHAVALKRRRRAVTKAPPIRVARPSTSSSKLDAAIGAWKPPWDFPHSSRAADRKNRLRNSGQDCINVI